MNRSRDAIELMKLANPVPDPERVPEGPASASAQALLEGILDMDQRRASIGSHRRRTAVILAAAIIVAGAGAAWAYTAGGMFSDPAFYGETWKLTVGQDRNGPEGDTYKVCHVFERREGATMGNGFGVAGCGDWPAAGDTTRASAIIEVVPALQTPEEIVLFIDLTPTPIGMVLVDADVGSPVEVQPYRMPITGKQYAVAELPRRARRATIRLLDHDGTTLQTQRVEDLSVAPAPRED